MTVEVRMTVRFTPWQAPNFATVQTKPGFKQDGMQPLPSIPVDVLDDDALQVLAQSWLTDLYAKAGKICPFTAIRQG